MVARTALVAMIALVLMVLAVVMSSCQYDIAGKATSPALLPYNHRSVDMNADGLENCEDARILYNYLEGYGARPFCEPGGQYLDGNLNSLDLISTGMRLRNLGVIETSLDSCLV